MTDLEINTAIAEACGWTCDKDTWTSPEGGRWARRVPGREISDEQILPNYCHDLNAMHEAEASQLWPDAAFWNRYSLELGGLCNSLAPALHATARQRAEAFLRTIGKWKP